MQRNKILILTVTVLLLIFFWGCASEQLTSARIYIREDNWEKAEEMLIAALDVEPDNPEVYYHLGAEIYARKEQWDKMNEMLDKALSLGADFKLPAGFTVREGVKNIRSKNWTNYYNKGAELFNEALQGADENKIANYESALEAFETAQKIDPEEPKTYRNLLFCYIQLEKQKEMIATLDDAMRRNPEDIELLLTAGQISLDDGDVDGAIELLEKALKINPRDSRVARLLADAYYNKGDREGAIFAYKKALREDPENIDLHFNMGVLYLQIDDFDLAEEKFQKVLKLDPDDRDAILGIAEAYANMEQWMDAEYYYKKVLRLEPDNPGIIKAYAISIYRQGRIDDAQEWFDKAKELE